MSETAGTPPPDAGEAGLRVEVATIGNDVTRWSYGNVIDRSDSVLAARGGSKGLAIYDELERDPKVGSTLDKRIAALVGREWQVSAGAETPEAEEVAELVRRALTRLPWNRCVREMMAALLKGVSMGEVMWEVVGNELLPAAIRSRNPMRFTFLAGQDGGPPELRLLTRAAMIEGVTVPPRKFLVHRRAGRYDDPWGQGLGYRLFWPVFFKRQGVAFWMSALEKFGQPTAVGKYPSGSKPEDVAKLVAALEAVASEAGVAVPEGMAIDLLEAKRSGTFDGYTSLASYMDSDIAQVILGETLTSDGGDNGSRALGEVHNGVRLEITKGDADELSDTLNTGFLRWIVELNRPAYIAAGKPMPVIWWDVSVPEDVAKRAERDTKVKNLGFRPTQDYITATYGEGWEADPAASPAQPGGPRDALTALFAEAAAASPRRGTRPPADDPRDYADILAGQLGPMTSEAIEPWLSRLRGAVAGASSMEEVRGGLMAVYAEMDAEPLAQLLGSALMVAELTGRNDLVADRAKGDPT